MQLSILTTFVGFFLLNQALEANPGWRPEQIEQAYRIGRLTEREVWRLVAKGDPTEANLPRLIRRKLRATILLKDRYPGLAAFVAADAIRHSELKPDAAELKPFWRILHLTRAHSSAQMVVEQILASRLTNAAVREKAPYFEGDWGYLAGNVLDHRSDLKGALQMYRSVERSSQFYHRSQFIAAILAYQSGDLKEAVKILEGLAAESDIGKGIDDHVHLTLGRVYFRLGQHEAAIEAYRQIDQSSPLFFRSVHEQTWPLLLMSQPDHALGMVYGVESPFFLTLNLEASLLKSMIYYSVCYFDRSQQTLAQFKQRVQNATKSLDRLLARYDLSPDAGYRYFENYILGVSQEKLGVSKAVAGSVMNRGRMVLLREQLAAVMEEGENLARRGVMGQRAHLEEVRVLLQSHVDQSRKRLGAEVLRGLKALRRRVAKLDEQSQFLELELMMSQKDSLQGKKLVANLGTELGDKETDWQPRGQEWAEDQTGEVWWDEVGRHIVMLEQRCKASGGS